MLEIASALAVVISALCSYLLFFHSRAEKHSEEALRDIIYPLFTRLEPYMKWPVAFPSESEWNQIVGCVPKENFLGGAQIDLIANTQYKDLSKDRFAKYCKIIDRRYTKLCRQQGIPNRTWKYRVENYRPIFSVKALFMFLLQLVGYLIFFLSLFLVGGYAFKSLADSGDLKSQLLAAFCGYTLLAFLLFVIKRDSK